MNDRWMAEEFDRRTPSAGYKQGEVRGVYPYKVALLFFRYSFS